MKNIKDTIRPFTPRFVINRYNMLKDYIKISSVIKNQSKPYVKGLRPAGINLYGDFELGTGLSRSVNLLKTDLELAGVPYSIHQIEEFSGIPADDKEEKIDYAINVFHLQPFVIPSLFKNISNYCRDEHYNIAHWAWETPEFPREWVSLCSLFDEIWTPSVFVAKAIRKVTDKPIHVYPHGVYVSEVVVPDRRKVREKYGIKEDAFVCLVLYDGKSGTERKNPEASIRAFRKAFSEEDKDVVLLIKGKNLTEREKKHLKGLIGEEYKVVHVEGRLSYEETEEILGSVDVLLSLHRAEGFGLPVAEVMQYGGVAITTNYSATTEFADEETACPIAYKLIKTKKDYSAYRAGTIWAEPDVDDAAEKLRRIYEDKDKRRIIGEKARESISKNLNSKTIGTRIKTRVEAICK